MSGSGLASSKTCGRILDLRARIAHYVAEINFEPAE
jgi:hypothetical protein